MQIDIGKPQADELEITTLGPGASSGESIVLHLTDDEWIIIDSCMAGDKILPLEYLHDIEVDYDKVTKVICTHWHTDHIKGLPEILRQCKNAQLYMAPVGDFKGYLDVVLKLAGIDPLGSFVWTILNNCLDTLEEVNHRSPKFISHNERFAHATDYDLYTIGPSDELIKRFHNSLLMIDPAKPSKDAVEKMEGNLCSVAFSIRFKDQKVLLGGDMEVGRKIADKYNYHLCETQCPEHEECGWCEAIEDGNIFSDEKPYHFVNMPHHSSSSAYCPKMWNEGMIKEGLIATTTAFKCGQGEDLPTSEMLELYRQRCSRLLTTNGVNAVKDLRDVKDFEGADGIEVIDEIIDDEGIIISRWRNEEEGWKITCYGTAKLVDDEFMKTYHVTSN